MDKQTLKKNRLDLEYRFESQKAIVFLTFGTITLLGFLAAVIIQKHYIIATVVGFIVFVFAIILYRNTKRNLDTLFKKIENLVK